MSIQVGSVLPEAGLMTLRGSLVAVSVSSYFSGSKVALVGVPGAFTPQCTAVHLPGFLARLDSFKQKGIDKVACLSVNDPFVMGAWASALGAAGRIDFLADGNFDFTRKVGLVIDASALGMGQRSKRYAMFVDSCEVKVLHVEENPTEVSVSSAEALLAAL